MRRGEPGVRQEPVREPQRSAAVDINHPERGAVESLERLAWRHLHGMKSRENSVQAANSDVTACVWGICV